MFDPLRNDFYCTERGGQISGRDHSSNLAAERTGNPAPRIMGTRLRAANGKFPGRPDALNHGIRK